MHRFLARKQVAWKVLQSVVAGVAAIVAAVEAGPYAVAAAAAAVKNLFEVGVAAETVDGESGELLVFANERLEVMAAQIVASRTLASFPSFEWKIAASTAVARMHLTAVLS